LSVGRWAVGGVGFEREHGARVEARGGEGSEEEDGGSEEEDSGSEEEDGGSEEEDGGKAPASSSSAMKSMRGDSAGSRALHRRGNLTRFVFPAVCT
jgi:hypothetical protein